MATTAKTNNVLAHLAGIQRLFIFEEWRFKKDELLALFMNNEHYSREARDLAKDAIDRMYEGLVGEGVVFGHHVVTLLDVVAIRYRNSQG